MVTVCTTCLNIKILHCEDRVCLCVSYVSWNQYQLRSYLNSTFWGLAVTLLTTRFNVKKFRMVLTLHVCVVYGYQNKELLLPQQYKQIVFL